MMIDRLPGEAIDIFVQAAGVGAAFPPVGRIAPPRQRVRPPRPGNGALACLYPHYMLFAVGMTPVPALVAPVMALVEAVEGYPRFRSRPESPDGRQ
jgi:hypothetical protein